MNESIPWYGYVTMALLAAVFVVVMSVGVWRVAGWIFPEAKKKSSRPKIVCLCGSSRFCDLVAVKAWEFEKGAILALGMHLLPSWYTDVADHLAEHEGVAETLDELHLEKIQLADFIYVVNRGGYIGERTRIEIQFAESLGKPIEYMEPIT